MTWRPVLMHEPNETTPGSTILKAFLAVLRHPTLMAVMCGIFGTLMFYDMYFRTDIGGLPPFLLFFPLFAAMIYFSILHFDDYRNQMPADLGLVLGLVRIPVVYASILLFLWYDYCAYVHTGPDIDLLWGLHCGSRWSR